MRQRTKREPPEPASEQRPRRRWLQFAASLVLVPTAFRVTHAQSDGGDILIGQSCQLTGPLAPLSSEIREGAKWYLDEVNRKGGVRGRRIKVLVLDDGYDPKRTAENTKQLVERDGVVALFNFAGTPTTLAALQTLRQSKVPLVAPFTGSDALRGTFERYVFNVRAGYSDEIDKIVQHLSTVGVRRVGVAYLNNAFGKSGLEAAKTAAAKYGVSLLGEAPLQVDGSGLKEVATTMSRSQPPAIILATAGKVTSDFIAAYMDIAPGTQFYALSVVSSQQLTQTLGPRGRGVAMTQVMPYPWGGGSRLARELTELAKSNGATSVTYNHMEGYVSAKVLVEGLRAVGPTPTRESLVQALESLREFDLGGFAVRFSDKNHNGSTYVELTIVGNDKKIVR